MIPEDSGFGGQYESYRENLIDDQIRDATSRVATSRRFAIWSHGHIVLRGTNTIVGYIGSSSLELCCPKDESPEKYRIPHKHLRRIFRAATNSLFNRVSSVY